MTFEIEAIFQRMLDEIEENLCAEICPEQLCATAFFSGLFYPAFCGGNRHESGALYHVPPPAACHLGSEPGNGHDRRGHEIRV